MKKTACVIGFLTCANAYAESQVNIYGVVDMGARHAVGLSSSNAPSPGQTNSLGSGINSTSRWGIRGREDLGGGTAVTFALESGLAADTGGQLNANAYFDRASWLGLSGRWGTLTAGRQTVLLADAVILTDPLGLRFASLNSNIGISALSAHGLGIEFGPSGSTAGSYRINNSVKYAANVGSLRLSAMYGFGEGSVSTAPQSSRGAGLAYKEGPLTVAASFQNFRAANFRELHAYVIGGAYQFETIRLAASFARNEADTTATTQTRQQVASVGATWALSPAVDLTAAYYDIKRRRTALAGDGFGRLIAFAEYKFSRRTAVYAEADATRWRGGYQGAVASARAKGVSVGVKHTF